MEENKKTNKISDNNRVSGENSFTMVDLPINVSHKNIFSTISLLCITRIAIFTLIRIRMNRRMEINLKMEQILRKMTKIQQKRPMTI